MTAYIYLSKPTAVVPVANVFVAGLLESAAAARFNEGVESLRLDYQDAGEAKNVTVTPQTEWEVSVIDAWDLVTDTETAAYTKHVRDTGCLDAARAWEFIDPSAS